MSLTGSIVLYNNDPEILSKAIESFVDSDMSSQLYIVDNSPKDTLKKYCTHSKITYIHNKENIGFGKAHNSIIRKIQSNSKYHLVMNPDIYFNPEILKSLLDFMKTDDSIGLIMPKILNPDGSIQHNCKLLPTPFNLIIRRFLYWNESLLKRNNFFYEMHFSGYDKIMEVPFLSGCFMFFNVRNLKKVGFFDERFFLYGEDIDLSRRMFESFKNLYFPEVHVYHHHEKGSYKSFRLMLRNIQSAIFYFNKWGWWDDNQRRKINHLISQRHLPEKAPAKVAKQHRKKMMSLGRFFLL